MWSFATCSFLIVPEDMQLNRPTGVSVAPLHRRWNCTRPAHTRPEPPASRSKRPRRGRNHPELGRKQPSYCRPCFVKPAQICPPPGFGRNPPSVSKPPKFGQTRPNLGRSHPCWATGRTWLTQRRLWSITFQAWSTPSSHRSKPPQTSNWSNTLPT